MDAQEAPDRMRAAATKRTMLRFMISSAGFELASFYHLRDGLDNRSGPGRLVL